MQTYKILKQDHVLLSQPVLIEHFGRAGAQFLSQLHYWLEKDEPLGCKHQDTRWIYNSAESWAQQLHLSVRQIRRLISKFVESGILQVKKLNPCKSIRTNYYSINYDKLNMSITSKTSQNRIFVHDDILSPSSCHNGTIYIETKTTNKDFNKSENQPENLLGQGEDEKNQVKRVQQVKKNILKIAKNTQEDSYPNKIPTEKTKTKNSTAQDMLAIWNDTLGEKAKTQMNRDLAPMLVSAYAAKFGRDLNQWKRYCELIGTSEYLMREKFDLSIFWALKFSTIDRLRAGGLGVKPEMIKQVAVLNDHQIEDMIEKLDESKEVKALRRTIAQVVGAADYYSWFQQAAFVAKEGEILLVAPNTFVEHKWEELFPWVNKRKPS